MQTLCYQSGVPPPRCVCGREGVGGHLRKHFVTNRGSPRGVWVVGRGWNGRLSVPKQGNKRPATATSAVKRVYVPAASTCDKRQRVYVPAASTSPSPRYVRPFFAPTEHDDVIELEVVRHLCVRGDSMR